MTSAQQIQQMYIAYYGRPADPAGLAWWVEQAEEQGMDWVKEAFTVSPEADRNDSNRTQEEMILAWYDQAFGRDPSTAEFQATQQQLASGVSRGQVLQELLEKAASNPDDQQVLNNRTQVADSFTQRVKETGTSYTEDDIPGASELVRSVTVNDNASDVAKAVQTVIASVQPGRKLADAIKQAKKQIKKDPEETEDKDESGSTPLPDGPFQVSANAELTYNPVTQQITIDGTPVTQKSIKVADGVTLTASAEDLVTYRGDWVEQDENYERSFITEGNGKILVTSDDNTDIDFYIVKETAKIVFEDNTFTNKNKIEAKVGQLEGVQLTGNGDVELHITKDYRDPVELKAQAVKALSFNFKEYGTPEATSLTLAKGSIIDLDDIRIIEGQVDISKVELKKAHTVLLGDRKTDSTTDSSLILTAKQLKDINQILNDGKGKISVQVEEVSDVQGLAQALNAKLKANSDPSKPEVDLVVDPKDTALLKALAVNLQQLDDSLFESDLIKVLDSQDKPVAFNHLQSDITTYLEDNTVAISGVTSGANWEYSVDGGESWNPGQGSQFELQPGNYEAKDIQVREAIGDLKLLPVKVNQEPVEIEDEPELETVTFESTESNFEIEAAQDPNTVETNEFVIKQESDTQRTDESTKTGFDGLNFAPRSKQYVDLATLQNGDNNITIHGFLFEQGKGWDDGMDELTIKGEGSLADLIHSIKLTPSDSPYGGIFNDGRTTIDATIVFKDGEDNGSTGATVTLVDLLAEDKLQAPATILVGTKVERGGENIGDQSVDNIIVALANMLSRSIKVEEDASEDATITGSDQIVVIMDGAKVVDLGEDGYKETVTFDLNDVEGWDGTAPTGAALEDYTFKLTVTFPGNADDEIALDFTLAAADLVGTVGENGALVATAEELSLEVIAKGLAATERSQDVGDVVTPGDWNISHSEGAVITLTGVDSQAWIATLSAELTA